MGLKAQIRFYFSYGRFHVQEQFSDLAGGLASFLLFPFFMWMLAMIWRRFNSFQGNYDFNEILIYIGVAELLFMTFLRTGPLNRASGDFSLGLARPRPWIMMNGVRLFATCLGGRIIYWMILFLFLVLMGIKMEMILLSLARALLLLLPLGIVQAQVALLFASAQVRFHETSYFVLPVSKIFLSLGGVFGPLTDYGQPWRDILIALPPSDLFFQPAHFCVKGSFFTMTGETWIFRLFLWILVLAVLNWFFYQKARVHHQSYGG